MLAAQFLRPDELSLVEVPTPEPGPGEVLLKVEAATICGTDLRIVSGAKSAGVRPGVIMGHEIAGRVHSVGAGVDESLVGKQAAVAIVVSCNHCRACLAGREHLCPNAELFGYAIDGGLAEYVLVPAKAVAQGNLITTTIEVKPTHLALAEPLSCVLNGFEQYRVRPGDTAVVLGAGAIGLLHTQLIRLAGASQVIVTNRSEARRDVALRLGATHVVAPDQIRATVDELTDGAGADVVVVCIGALPLADEALALAGPGGRVNYFAGFPKGSRTEFDPNMIHYEELQVTGGSNASRELVRRAVRLLESGAIDGDAIVTHTFRLDQLDEAFAAVENRAGVKVAITP